MEGDGFPKYDEGELADVCSSIGIRMLVAFGSFVTGRPAPAEHSDLDLAVLDGDAYTRGRFVEVLDALQSLFDVPIDLAFLHQADPLFRYEIFRGGRLLFGDVDDFLNQRAYAYRGFVDSRDLRELEETLFRKKMAYLDRQLNAST